MHLGDKFCMDLVYSPIYMLVNLVWDFCVCAYKEDFCRGCFLFSFVFMKSLALLFSSTVLTEGVGTWSFRF